MRACVGRLDGCLNGGVEPVGVHGRDRPRAVLTIPSLVRPDVHMGAPELGHALSKLQQNRCFLHCSLTRFLQSTASKYTLGSHQIVTDVRML